MQVFQGSFRTHSPFSAAAAAAAVSPGRLSFVLSVLLFTMLAVAVQSLSLPTPHRHEHRHLADDVTVTDAPAASEVTHRRKTSTLADSDDLAATRYPKRIASVAWYRIDPLKSQSQRSNAMLTSSKDINLMIFPMSSIIVFTVLIAIRISRWCVEDLREADESTHRDVMRDVMRIPSRPDERCRRMSNDYVPVNSLYSSTQYGSRMISDARSSGNGRVTRSNAALATTGSSRSRTSSGRRRPHDSSRVARLKAHTADGRRRDGLSTTSIPLAELLSTTVAPILPEGRDLLLSADRCRLLRPAGTADDIVERCRRAGGHVIVFPSSSTVSSTSHRTRKRNYSSPASTASTSLNSSSATTSSWCSDTRPFVRLSCSRSNSTSTTADDRFVTSSNSTIDVSTSELMTSSSPQLVRGCSGRSGCSGEATNDGTAKRIAAKSGPSRQFTTRHLKERQNRQIPQTAPPVLVSRLAHDSLNLSMRFFHIPLGGVQCSTIATPSSDNVLQNSADSVFICSISANNGETSLVSPPGDQLMRRIIAAETLDANFSDSSSNKLGSYCDSDTVTSVRDDDVVINVSTDHVTVPDVESSRGAGEQSVLY